MTGLFQPLASCKKARCNQAEQPQVRLGQVVLAAPPLRRLAREGRALGSLALGRCCIPCRLQKRWSRLKRGGGRGSAFPIPEIANRRGESSPLRSPPPPLDVTTTRSTINRSALGRPTMASLSSVPVQRTGGVRRMAACACMPAAAVNAASATPEAAKSANFNYKHAVAPQMGGEVAVLALG